MPTGDLEEFDIVLPEEAVQALMRFTRAKTPEEAVERCVKLLPGRAHARA